MSFIAEALDANDKDFTDAKKTPGILEGRGKMVYWMDCDTASIARYERDTYHTIIKLPTEGKGLLPAGLILYCNGGKMKEDP